MVMMAGYLMTSLGSFAILFGIIMHEMNPRYDDEMLVVCAIGFVLLAAGIITIVFNAVKNKNSEKLNSLMNLDNGVPKNACPNCKINLAEGCSMCPNCGHLLTGGNDNGKNNNSD